MRSSRRASRLVGYWLALVSFAAVVSAGIPTQAQSSRAGVWDARTSSQESRTGQNRQTTGQYSNQNRYQQYQQRQAGQPQSQGRGRSSNYEDSLLSNGVRRRFQLHVPASYDGRRPLPLVFAFHGLQMTGDSMRAITLLDLTADKYGFIVCYPDGIGNRWNDDHLRCGEDDVRFVSEMIGQIGRRLAIDTRRVYACGISNGGFFAQKLACELSGNIAAIAVVSASANETMANNCRCRRPVPVMFFIGSDDPLIPRANQHKELDKLGDALGLTELGVTSMSAHVAKMGGYMTADEAVGFWVKQNSSSANPRTESLPDRSNDGCKVTRESYSGPGEVVVYEIEGGGHTWPGGMTILAKDLLGRTTNDINASELIWQFFYQHPMH